MKSSRSTRMKGRYDGIGNPKRADQKSMIRNMWYSQSPVLCRLDDLNDNLEQNWNLGQVVLQVISRRFIIDGQGGVTTSASWQVVGDASASSALAAEDEFARRQMKNWTKPYRNWYDVSASKADSDEKRNLN